MPELLPSGHAVAYNEEGEPVWAGPPPAEVIGPGGPGGPGAQTTSELRDISPLGPAEPEGYEAIDPPDSPLTCGECLNRTWTREPICEFYDAEEDEEGETRKVPRAEEEPVPWSCRDLEPEDITTRTALSPFGTADFGRWIGLQTKEKGLRGLYAVHLREGLGFFAAAWSYDAEEDRVYTPIPPEQLVKPTTLPALPSGFRDVSGVVKDLKKLMDNDTEGRPIVEFPADFWRDVTALYVVLGAVHDLPGISEVPYLDFVGEPGSGKSRAAEAMHKMIPYAIMAGANPSEAYIYRVLDQQRPATVVITEKDLSTGNSGNPLIQVLNAGYSKEEGYVGRCVGENHDPRQFYCYGPKIFCTREYVGEEGLGSRTPEITLKESDEASLKPFNDEWRNRAQKAVDALAQYRVEAFFKGLDSGYDAQIEGLRGDIKLRILELLKGLFAAAPSGHEDLLDKLAYHLQRDLTKIHENTLKNLVIEAYVRKLWKEENRQYTLGDDEEPPRKAFSSTELYDSMNTFFGEDSFNFKNDRSATTTIGRTLSTLGFESKRGKNRSQWSADGGTLRKLVRGRFPPDHDLHDKVETLYPPKDKDLDEGGDAGPSGSAGPGSQGPAKVTTDDDAGPPGPPGHLEKVGQEPGEQGTETIQEEVREEFDRIELEEELLRKYGEEQPDGRLQCGYCRSFDADDAGALRQHTLLDHIVYAEGYSRDDLETWVQDHLATDEQDLGNGEVTIRALRDVEPFIGTDGETYDLDEGDEVDLPEKSAEVLIETGKAEEVEL